MKRCKKHRNQSLTSIAVFNCNDCRREKLVLTFLRQKKKCTTCGSVGKIFERTKWVCGKMEHKIPPYQISQFKKFKKQQRLLALRQAMAA